MRYILTMIGVLLMAIGINSCDRDEDGDGSGEQNLVINIDPNPGSSIVRTMGSTYDFNVAIASRIPPQGVNVIVAFRQDSDDRIVSTQNYSTTTSPLQVTVSDIPFNEVGTVIVTAVSKSRNTNTASKIFKLVRK